MKSEYAIGIDPAVPGADKTVITRIHGGIITVDEYAGWSNPKWYRQPRLWWTFWKIRHPYTGKKRGLRYWIAKRQHRAHNIFIWPSK